MDAVIKFDLVLVTNEMQSWCDVCGAGFWDRYAVVAKNHDGVLVCPGCFQHPDEIDARLEQHAADFEQRAAENMQLAQTTRALIGQIQTLPSFKEWQAAENDSKTFEQYCELY